MEHCALHSLGQVSRVPINPNWMLTVSRIEDYCIPIAATAPIIRLFIRTFVDHRTRTGGTFGTSGSAGPRSKTGGAMELSGWSQSRSQVRAEGKGFTNVDDKDEMSDFNTHESLNGSENGLVDHHGIIVKQEYEVRVEDRPSNDLPIVRA